MKKIIPFLACMLVALVACEKDDVTPPASVESMQFEGVSTTLDEGESINLSQYLIITPQAVGDTVTVDWSSSDETVATVSASGSVETLKAGSVTITAKAMDKTAQISLTIEEVEIKEFTIPAHLELYVGEKIKFPINDLKPKNAPTYRFEWEADNDGQIPTYSEGKWYLKADKEREYTLTVSVDDAEEAKCNVKFVKPSVSKLAFYPASYTVEEGSSLSLVSNLQVTPAEGVDADTIKVTWSSSKETVATIDQNGKVQAVAAGKATITAQAGSKTATCTVEVTAKPAPEDPETPEDPEKPDTPIDPSDPTDPEKPDTPIDPSDPEIPIVTEYTVSYDANGGTGSMSDVKVKENETITIAENTFTRSMSLFVGWNTRADGNGTSYNSGVSLVVTGNVTLYAQWKNMTDAANGYEFVDLGLSVLWATCNIGADSPEEYGDYYAWGETTTKDSYSRDNYVGWGDEGVLPSSKDVASVKMRGSWRMPDKEELVELLEKCNWTSTTKNGISGNMVTSKINGNSIFLPNAGMFNEDTIFQLGKKCAYWSRISDYDDVYDDMFAYTINSKQIEGINLYYGCTVRAVLPK